MGDTVARARDAGEAKLRAFLEAAAQGILAIDESSRIVLVNAKIEEQFGYSREELLGSPLDILIPKRFRERHAANVAGYFRNPKQRPMGVGLELTGLKKDGTEFPVEISLSYFEDGDSRLGIAFITDITARKRIEEQLRETAKLESLGVLAGGIAHDFNNLLVGVIGNAGLALEATPPDSPLRARLEAIQQAGERAADLVRQLLAYSGKGRFVIEPVNISDLIRETVRLIEASVQNAVLVLDLQASASIHADASQIQQLIMNLVINAAEAIGESDGTVTVRTRERDLAGPPEESGLQTPPAGSGLQALKPGRYVEIVVEDTGSGMDEPTRERIFDPFFTTKFTGRGLGLAAALGIVRGHKGYIEVQSEPGKGSRFSVLFPVSAEREPEPAPAKSDLQGSGTILVVDDEEIVRSSAATALQRYGYDVLTAENGRRAIEIVRRDASIVAVVLDLTMPIMSGEETLRHLRELRPDLPVILSSGYSAEEAVKRFRSQGLAGFLQKPYTAVRLAEAIKAARAQATAGPAASG
ncbi:MAG: PAS domain S-box protein [bacterium]